MKRIVLLLTLVMCGWAFAQEPAHPAPEGEAPHAGEAAGAEGEHEGLEMLSHDSSWAGVMVIIVIALFVAAAAVGVAVMLNAPPPEEPVAAGHGHDEHAAGDEHGGGHGGEHGHGH